MVIMVAKAIYYAKHFVPQTREVLSGHPIHKVTTYQTNVHYRSRVPQKKATSKPTAPSTTAAGSACGAATAAAPLPEPELELLLELVELLPLLAVFVPFEHPPGRLALAVSVTSAHWKSSPSPPSKMNWSVTFAPFCTPEIPVEFRSSGMQKSPSPEPCANWWTNCS